MTTAGADARTAGLLAALEDLPVPDARTARSLEEVRAGLLSLPRPFDQDADRTHVTASAVVVGPRGVVLHRHKRLGLWLQPGGHVDGAERPEDAAVREVAEETGLAVAHPGDGPRLVHVDAHDGGRGHRHLDLRYLLLAGDADPAPGPQESQDVRWFSWDDAVALADDGLVAALRLLRDDP